MTRLSNGLEITEVAVGKGQVAQARRKVNVRYRGTLLNGKQFDAGKIAFRLGAGEVIKGCEPREARTLVQCPRPTAYRPRPTPHAPRRSSNGSYA